jgi:hypothetical protein
MSTIINAMMLNPLMAARTLAQMGNASSWFRGIVRVNSEAFGFPQTVPDKRKMDYAWRDLYMPWANAYAMELTYRLAEQVYVSPNFKKFMDLDKIGIKEIPAGLSTRMLGSVVNPRSYELVPDLLETRELPALEKKLAHLLKTAPGNTAAIQAARQEVTQMQVLSNHIRKIVNPEQYIDRYLVGTAKTVTPREARVLKSYLRFIDNLSGLFAKANKDQILDVAIQKIKAQNLPRAKQVELIAKLKDEPLQQLVRRLKDLAKNPLVKDSPFLKELAGLTDAQLIPKIGKALKPEVIIEKINKEIVMPRFIKSKAFTPELGKLMETLAGSKLKQAQLFKVFEGSNFWLKLPLSILGIFLMYGLMANTFDNKFIQPYQREVSKRRGGVREIIPPAFFGILPGAVAFIGVAKLPFVQRLGYIPSFAVAGAAGLAAFFTTAAVGFQYLIRKSAKTNPAPETPRDIMYTDNPFPLAPGAAKLQPKEEARKAEPPMPVSQPPQPQMPQAYQNPFQAQPQAYAYSTAGYQPYANYGWYPQTYPSYWYPGQY